MKNKLKTRIEVSPLANNNMSGIGNYTLLLAEAMSKDKDIELELDYFNFLNRQHEPNIKNVKVKKNNLIPLRIYAKLSSFGIAPFWDMFKKKVDLTIFTNFSTWPTIKSKYVATAIHDLTYIYFPEVVESKNLAHLKRSIPRTVKKADIIITISKAIKDELRKEFDINEEKIVVTHIPPSVEFRRVCTATEKEKVKHKYGTPDKYIYFIGTFEPRKNLSRLIDAYLLLPKELRREYGLILAGGKGWSSKETEEKLSSAIKKGENIKHIGYIDQSDSAALYQNASLFVMPSIYEGFGIPILEAMLSECPVAASDIPVLRETAGRGALYFDSSSSEAMADTIQKVLKDSILRDSLIKMGAKNVSRFSWEKNTASIKEAVRRLENN